jgi:dipeptidyl aminopeptidase/acylaminoacyl peptidase
MTRQATRVLATIVALVLWAGAGLAQEAAGKVWIEQALRSAFSVRTFRETALAPDGRHVAWVEAAHDDEAAGHGSAVYVADLQAPGAAPRRISAGSGKESAEEHGLAWSADGKRLAFLSDHDKKGQLQLYVVPVEGGTSRRLTNVSGLLREPRWSPDGSRIGVLFTEGAPDAGGPLGPGAVQTGVIEEEVHEQRLAIVDVESGSVRQASPADMHIYEFDWSPDGTKTVAVAAHGSGDNNWWVAQLYTLDLASGAMTSILKPAMQIAVPRWSPDGKTIAFVGGLMSDEGANGGDVFTISAEGGKERNLTPSWKGSASWLTWGPDSSRLMIVEWLDGGTGIAEVGTADGRVTNLWTGPESINAQGWVAAVSPSRDLKTCALIRQSFTQPPDVWAGPVGNWKQLTHANQDQLPRWGQAKSLHWKSDEFTVQGWLIYPRDYDPGRRYPMVVSVHGGPAAAKLPRFTFDWKELSAAGYFVLFPNPRGSYGQGEAFTRANVKDFGYGDLRDILAGVDEVTRTLPVDSARIGLTGWSYGGYMTMWAVTQTERFRCAMAGAGVSNWQSYYGENGIDQWMIPYFGATVYDDPAVYARSSPIAFIKRVKTPTLVLVGERDVECPVPQSFEFWHALKTLGVPTQLVVYAGEGHGIRKVEHRRDMIRRTAAWFDKYLRDGNGSGAGQGR